MILLGKEKERVLPGVISALVIYKEVMSPHQYLISETIACEIDQL